MVKAEFTTSIHNSVRCTGCHGGDFSTLDKKDAHKGIVSDPSRGDKNVCTACHKDINIWHSQSVHASSTGFRTMVLARSDESVDIDRVDEMLDSKCSECHTTCGQCHVSRPSNVFGGFVDGHNIYKTPSDIENCTRCHGSRIGEEFFGAGFGAPPNVHQKAGMGCLDCHPKDSFHSRNTVNAPTRYEVPTLPQCIDCHDDIETEGGMHRKAHLDKVQCNVCHSINYKNCFQCHVGLEEKGTRIDLQFHFRIGKNPIKSEKRPYDYVVLRHPPIAPDTFEEWGIKLANFTSLPTWRYASPHNIQRFTRQNISCDGCHDSNEFLLTQEFIESLIEDGTLFEQELEANLPVILEEIPSRPGKN